MSAEVASSSSLKVRCPSCFEPCETEGTDSTREIQCRNCGSVFNLSPERTRRVPGHDGMISQFQLLDHLGTGSFGQVWLAKDTVLDRHVALKVAHPDRFEGNDADRFFREARAAAQLKHPNIVSVHEVGRDGDHIFIVTDFIRGATLADHLSSKRFSIRQAVELCAAIADGLHHAHEAGVVHRDLKPQNILLDLAGVPHITDFGLAKREQGELTITVDGHVMGTPSYMSPEQAQGLSHQTDRRTDLYSLGVILFLMLTGELPFRGNFRMVMIQAIYDPPPSPRRLESKVPKDLETICLKCLEKRPEHRYATAEDLAEDLRRWLTHRPIHASPPGPVGRLVRWSRRKPAQAALSFLLLAVTLVGLTAFGWQYQQTMSAHRELLMSQVEGLMTSTPDETRVLLANLARFGDEVVPELKQVRENPDLNEPQRMRYSLALLPHRPSEADYLYEQLVHASAGEVRLICEALRSQRETRITYLWERVRSDATQPSEQLRLAAALAMFDAKSDQWSGIAHDVVTALETHAGFEPVEWLHLLTPAREWLIPAFRQLFESSHDRSTKLLAAQALVQFFAGEPHRHLEWVGGCDAHQLPLIAAELGKADSGTFEELRLMAAPVPSPTEEQTTTICNAALALALNRQPGALLALFEKGVSPEIRLRLIQLAAPVGLDAQLLSEELSQNGTPAVRQAILLALGEYEDYQLTSRFRLLVGEMVRTIHSRDPDTGVHSAAQWLLRQWQIPVPELPVAKEPPSNSNWYVDSAGQTMSMIRGPVTYFREPRESERSAGQGDAAVRVDIGHSYAISMTELTREQFERFTESEHVATVGPEPDCPVNNLTYNEVAAYCNWLSRQEGLSEDQLCFPPVDLKSQSPVVPYDDYLSRAGYRLPTSAEWEYACRGGTVGNRFTGDSIDLFRPYAWFDENSDMRTWPVAIKKPNDFGLFDVFGNLDEMTFRTEKSPGEARPLNVISSRGGAFNGSFHTMDAGSKVALFSTARYYNRGVRLCRTLAR